MISTANITQSAKIWAGYIAKEVKVQSADNPDTIFLIGRTLLDKNGFNSINDGEHDVVHGLQVIYGPFSNRQSAQEFVADYPCEWPGHNEWKYVKAGQVEIISPYFDPGMSDIVHNKSLDFQGQVLYNEQQRILSEINDAKKKHTLSEDASNIRITTNEKAEYLLKQANMISQLETQISQMKKHILFVQSLSTTD